MLPTTTTSSTPETAAGGAATQARGGTFPQLVLMEWVKFRSLRSTVWTLLLAAACSVGLTALIAGLAGSSEDMDQFNVVETTAFGPHTAQIFMIVLGALVVTAEYTSGSIRTTLAAVRGRGRLMAAKAAVLAGATFASCALIAAASWTVAGALLPGGFDAGADEAARMVTAGATYPMLIALLTFGTGMLLRSTAATLAVMMGLLAVIPSLFPFLPEDVADRVLPAMPPYAAEVFLTGQAQEGDYGPWAALAVLCAWAAVAIAAGYGTLKGRDA
jgi:ABC-2 type transport system permease protein